MTYVYLRETANASLRTSSTWVHLELLPVRLARALCTGPSYWYLVTKNWPLNLKKWSLKRSSGATLIWSSSKNYFLAETLQVGDSLCFITMFKLIH